jgi:hypothetical protein
MACFNHRVFKFIISFVFFNHIKKLKINSSFMCSSIALVTIYNLYNAQERIGSLERSRNGTKKLKNKLLECFLI